MSTHQNSETVPFIVAIVVATMAFCLYAPTALFSFAYDDYLQIVLNPQVTESDASSFVRILKEPTPPGNLYRPLTTVSYAATHAYFGLSAHIFHFSNVILYVITTLVALWSLSQILPSARAATIGAFFFVAHPLHTEAVANIIGRAEVLSTLFALVSFSFVRKSVLSEKAPVIGGSLVLGALCFCIASLCKESSLSLGLPIVVSSYCALSRSVPWQVRCMRIFPAFSTLAAVSLLALYLRWSALGSNFIIPQDDKIWIENPIFNEPFWARIIPSCAILGEYLRLLILPLYQSADYSSTPQQFFLWLASYQGMLSLAVVAALPLLVKWRRETLVPLLWLLSGFILTVNLLTPIGTLMGERLAFAPSFGAAAVCGLLLDQAIQRYGRFAWYVVSGYLSIFVALTVTRIPVWQNNETLFHASVLDSPNSPKAWYNLGVEAVLKDSKSVLAEQCFRRALELSPGYLLPTQALADIMLARGDFGRLEYWYRSLLEIDPDNGRVRSNLELLIQKKQAMQ